MSSNASLLGKATTVHTPTSNTRRVPVTAQVCDLHVPPARAAVIGRCEFYYRPLHGEYVEKSGVSTWQAIKAWATQWNPWDDKEVVERLLKKRDKLIPGDTSDGDWSRHANFMMRHIGCGHLPPAYYVSYGYYYCSTYGAQLLPKLSGAGKQWLMSARWHLQANMENGLADNMVGHAIDVPCARFPNKGMKMRVPKGQLEINNQTFKTFAFNTHVPAYLDGGLADLPVVDLALIGGQPNIEEWIDKDTWKQAIDSGLVVGEEKVKGAVRSIGDFVDATIEKLTSWKN